LLSRSSGRRREGEELMVEAECLGREHFLALPLSNSVLKHEKRELMKFHYQH